MILGEADQGDPNGHSKESENSATKEEGKIAKKRKAEDDKIEPVPAQKEAKLTETSQKKLKQIPNKLVWGQKKDRNKNLASIKWPSHPNPKIVSIKTARVLVSKASTKMSTIKATSNTQGVPRSSGDRALRHLPAQNYKEHDPDDDCFIYCDPYVLCHNFWPKTGVRLMCRFA